MSNWPHSPPHGAMEAGTYMLTAGTYGKSPHFAQRFERDFFGNN
jgi:hypothetical protein